MFQLFPAVPIPPPIPPPPPLRALGFFKNKLARDKELFKYPPRDTGDLNGSGV